MGLAADLEVEAELFLSTWALSESSAAAHDLVESRRWYGADRLLAGNHYAFR